MLPSLALSLSFSYSLSLISPSDLLSSDQLTSSSLHFGEEETQHLLHLLETYSGENLFPPTNVLFFIYLFICL